MAEEIRPTVLKRMELYQDRWSSYGANTGIQEIAETPSAAYVKQIDIFQEYDDTHNSLIALMSLARLWRESDDASILERVASVLKVSPEEVEELLQKF